MASAQTSQISTVIVGAGVIGLFAAFQLAILCRKTGHQAKITVLEAHDAVFAGCSGNWSGYMTPWEDPPELTTFSMDLWKTLAAARADFPSTSDPWDHVHFLVRPGIGTFLENLPDWLHPEEDWDVLQEMLPNCAPSAAAEPSDIAEWLEVQCGLLGIDIILSSVVHSAELNHRNMIAAVTYSTRDGADVRIRADNLVIAAGAWTERLFDKLFPRSDVDLQFDAPSAKDYLVLQNQLVPLVENSINKVSLDDVVGHQLDFIGRLDETIWVGSELDATPILPPPGTVIHPDQKTIEELYEYSKRWVRTDFRPGYDPENEYPEDEYPEEEFLEEYNPELEGPEEEEDEPPPPQPAIRRSSASTPEPRPLYSPRIVQRVRTFLPRTVSGCPVIAEVTTAKLITGVPFNPPGHRSGVFINSGHYIDGLYQAIGSGLLMAHLILGRKPELDMEHFGLHYKSERWRNWSDLGERDEVSAKRLKEEEV